MSDNLSTDEEIDVTKSGVFPRAVIEPPARREAPPPPNHLPESKGEGATTGRIRIAMTEGEDKSADRDEDAAAGK
jgi:hypothetical protein